MENQQAREIPIPPPAPQYVRQEAQQPPPMVAQQPLPMAANPAITVVGSQRIERFDIDEPVAWFIQFEATLRINRVPTDDHYDYLLASLSREARAPIVFQLQSPPEDPDSRYKWLKQVLIEGHSKSLKEKLRQLVAGERIGDRKPSIFLAHLSSLAPDHMDKQLLKEFWWKELPTSMRAILSPMENLDSSALAAAADAIHAELGSASINAIRPATAGRSSEPTTSEIMAMLKQMQKEIRKLQEERQPQRESRDRQQGNNSTKQSEKPKARNPSKDRDDKSRSDEGFCKYHKKFREAAYICRPGCKWPKN